MEGGSAHTQQLDVKGESAQDDESIRSNLIRKQCV
jgi:hypothetical protein